MTPRRAHGPDRPTMTATARAPVSFPVSGQPEDTDDVGAPRRRVPVRAGPAAALGMLLGALSSAVTVAVVAGMSVPPDAPASTPGGGPDADGGDEVRAVSVSELAPDDEVYLVVERLRDGGTRFRVQTELPPPAPPEVPLVRSGTPSACPADGTAPRRPARC
ncbi:hypothetical protein [Isoptericola haloaureus]|uniref:Uncharacterized protein n=1 Tax=Isoptericola haloaureus TaxID=1542902 RepID=A0ABU7Z3B5_9MICO